MQPFTKTFKAGAHLFHENDHSRELYIVQAGVVKIFRQIGGREVELALMEKGSVFGEMALIDGKPRSASASAVTDAIVSIIDAESFESKIKGVPPWYLSIIKIVSSKIRKANKHLQIIGSWNRGCAVILSLHYLLARDGKPDGDNHLCLDVRETAKRLIQLLGLTHQFIMQQFDFLHVKGFLETKDTAIVFLDPARFRRYVSFLRLYFRKGFEKMPTVSVEAVRVCEALSSSKGTPALLEETPCPVSANEVSAAIATLGLQEKSAGILTELKASGLVSSQKKEGADGKAAAGPLVCDMALMNRLSLHQTFSTMVPLA